MLDLYIHSKKEYLEMNKPEVDEHISELIK